MYITVNQCERDQETYPSALPAEIWYQVACSYFVNKSELLIMSVTIVNVSTCTKHAPLK